MSKSAERATVTTVRLQNIAQSYGQSAALMAAVELGVFTAIARGAGTFDEIARAVGILPTNAERLVVLHRALSDVVRQYAPEAAAVEETFVNKNAASTLKLGLARGVALLVPALAGLPVAEYPANLIKKSVVGVGHAEKAQVQAMVRMLLPGARLATADSADALAVAICHAHHAATRRLWDGDAAAPRARVAGAAP